MFTLRHGVVDVGVFWRFRERILEGGGTEVVLTRSFRSHVELVHAVDTVFSKVLGDLHQDLEAQHEEPPH